MYKNIALLISTVDASCPAGSMRLDDNSCTLCPGGTFGYIPGLTDCLSCPADTFSGMGAKSCTLCADSTYSNAGSSSCGRPFVSFLRPRATCARGYTTVGNQCRICKPGQYEHNQECVDCTVGQFSSLPGQTECKNCVLGFSTVVTDTSTCLPCPAGLFTEAAGSPCESAKPPSDTQSTAATEFVRAVDFQLSGILENLKRKPELKTSYSEVLSTFKCLSNADSLACRFGNLPAKIAYPQFASKALSSITARKALFEEWVKKVSARSDTVKSLAELEKLSIDFSKGEHELLSFVTLQSPADLESLNETDKEDLRAFLTNVDYIQTVQILLAPADARVILTGIRSALRARTLIWLGTKIADVEPAIRAQLEEGMHTTTVSSLRATAMEAVNSIYGLLPVLRNTTLHGPLEDLAQNVNNSLQTNSTLKSTIYGQRLHAGLGELVAVGAVAAGAALRTALSSSAAVVNFDVVASVAVATCLVEVWRRKYDPIWEAEKKYTQDAASFVKKTAFTAELAKLTADAAENLVVALLQRLHDKIISQASDVDVNDLMRKTVEALNPKAKLGDENSQSIALFIKFSEMNTATWYDDAMKARHSQFIYSCLSAFQMFETYTLITKVKVNIANYSEIRKSLSSLAMSLKLSPVLRQEAIILITSLGMLNGRLSDYYNPTGRSAIAMSNGLEVSEAFSNSIRKTFSDVSELKTHLGGQPTELFATLDDTKTAILGN